MTITAKQHRKALALIARYDGQKSAKVSGKGTKVAKTKVSRRKVEGRAVKFDGTVSGHRCLIRKNRTMFIADHDWAQSGTPVSTLVQAVIDGAPLTGSWAISANAVARATGLDEAKVQPITPASQGSKPAKKGKKGKGKKAKAAKSEPVVEPVETIDVPEWGSKEWIATTHPREKDTPRNAKGQPTPRREWPIRISLEETGKYDRNEVDTKVQAAYDAGLITV